MVEVIVPLGMFLMIFAICAVIMVYRFRTRKELQLTIRSAIDSGQALSAEVLSELTAALHPKKNDLRRGLVLIGVGLAFVVFSVVVPDDEAGSIFLGLSAFPFFIGIAYLVIWFMNREQPQNA